MKITKLNTSMTKQGTFAKVKWI